jgi:mRNA interferase RelE/StbE
MYQAIILPKALDDLSRLERRVAQRIVDRLTWFSENMSGISAVPLRGNLAGFYKLRVGDWRVIYDIDHEGRKIFVHRIGHRRDIYK